MNIPSIADKNYFIIHAEIKQENAEYAAQRKLNLLLKNEIKQAIKKVKTNKIYSLDRFGQLRII